MDIFARQKFLIRMIIILVILNVCSVSVFLWKGFSHPHHEPPLFRGGDYRDVSGILQKELNLTTEQTAKIKTLRSDFFEKEKQLEAVIRGERDSMNVAMFNKITDEKLILTLAENISKNEYQMELMRYEQAQELKSICTPEQLEKFQELVLEIRDYFRPDNQPKENKETN